MGYPHYGLPEDICSELARERSAQDQKWGQQNHPNGTGDLYTGQANMARSACKAAFGERKGTWRHILDEEVMEAFAEEDPQKLREELKQVAAVCIAWMQAIDRRGI